MIGSSSRIGGLLPLPRFRSLPAVLGAALALTGAAAGDLRAQCGGGCADGQREGFVDEAAWPDVAGCSGGFSIAGVHDANPGFAPSCPGLPTFDTMTPACGRGGGDDGANPNGVGCNVADLCEAGWHVCESVGEVAALSPTGCAGATVPGDPLLFFATRVTSNGCGACASGTRTDPDCDSRSCTAGCLQTAILSNDFWGCGNFGGLVACTPLDRFSGNLCGNLFGSSWSCNSPLLADDVGYCEAYTAMKSGPDGGGVLCCRDVPVGAGPVVDCAALLVAAPDRPRSAFVPVTAGVTGGCGAVSVSNDRTAGGLDASDRYPCGSTFVTFEARDALGRTGSCVTEVRVEDAAVPREVSSRGAPVPLRVRWDQAAAPAVLRLTFADDGDPTALFNAYGGSIEPAGIFAYDHRPAACAVLPAPAGPGAAAWDVPFDAGRSRYFLVTLSNCAGEGSRGVRSTGAERPALPTDCGPLR